MTKHGTAVVSSVLVCALLCGCENPDAPSATAPSKTTVTAANRGEPPAPSPPSPARQAPADVQPSERGAISAFAALYVNWNYRTLTADQRRLARMAVGAARLAERQGAASSGSDQTITRGQVFNSGQLVSVAQQVARVGWWVIVTLERTGGNTQYEGLPAAYHVTLAALAKVPGGYAVEQWLPQS
jgi:hypothetical protein